MCVQWINTGGEQVDELTAQEETEDKLKQCIDNLMDKRWGVFPFLQVTKIKTGSVRKDKTGRQMQGYGAMPEGGSDITEKPSY